MRARRACRRQPRRGARARRAMRVWLRLHWHAFADAFRRLAAQPLGAAFSILVLAVAIMLPVLAAVGVRSPGPGAAGPETDPPKNLALPPDASDGRLPRGGRRVRGPPDAA